MGFVVLIMKLGLLTLLANFAFFLGNRLTEHYSVRVQCAPSQLQTACTKSLSLSAETADQPCSSPPNSLI